MPKALAITSYPTITERNWSVLGLLRFLLAFSVVTCHVSNATGHYAWQWLFGAFAPVCGFFMISGVSIAASLAARRQGYFARRVRRIFPLSLAAIAFTLVVMAAIGPGETWNHIPVALPPALDIAATMALLNGLAIATPFIFQPLWTLNCEIVYYLAAPLLARLSTSVIAILALYSAGLFFVPLLRGVAYNYAAASHGIALASLAWLWLLGFAAQRHPGHPLLVALGVIGAGWLIADRAEVEGALSLPLFIATALAVTALPYVRLPQWAVRPANYLGELSYPLYVLHFPMVLLAWRDLAGQNPVWVTLCVWTASLALAIAGYHGIDRRFRFARRG